MGKSIPQNYGEALKWFRKAADQDLHNAQLMVGYIHFNGNGITEDHAQYYKRLKISERHGMDKERVDKITKFLYYHPQKSVNLKNWLAIGSSNHRHHNLYKILSRAYAAVRAK